MSDTRTSKVKLDWSRLLGFDQAASACDDAGAMRIDDPRLARLGSKIGPKPGIHLPA
jgi:hypothetical protein